MSKWKIIREQDDAIALRLSIGAPIPSQEGYIVYRGDTKKCLELLENALKEMKQFYEEQGE